MNERDPRIRAAMVELGTAAREAPAWEQIVAASAARRAPKATAGVRGLVGRLRRRKAEASVPTVVLGRSDVERTPRAPTGRRGVLIAAAAMAAALLIAVPLWFVFRGEEGPAVTEPGMGLDALYEHHAGPVPETATCPPGSTPDIPGDPAAPRPITGDDGEIGAAFDRESGLLVAAVGTTTWAFDPCRNHWRQMQTTGPDFSSRGFMAYDADSDLIVAVVGDDQGEIWTYDVDSQAWAKSRYVLPATSPALYHDGSGLVLVYQKSGPAWAYDAGADTLEELAPSFPASNSVHPILGYDPVGDHFLFYDTPKRYVWWYQPGLGWEKLDIPTHVVDFSYGDMNAGTESAFDEAAGWWVIFGGRGTPAALDPTVPEWVPLDELGVPFIHQPAWQPSPEQGPGLRFRCSVVYDSANGRLIVLGGLYQRGDRWLPATDVWALDLRGREWIELLPAG